MARLPKAYINKLFMDASTIQTPILSKHFKIVRVNMYTKELMDIARENILGDY